jgi:hypothetical protein
MTADTEVDRFASGDAAERVASRTWWLRPDAFGPPLLALVLGWGLDAWRHSWSHVFSPATFSRWDSSWYLIIANQGYSGGPCPPNLVPPGTPLPASHYLCGSVGWFPGYPALLRGFSEITTLSLPVAGLIVAWVAWYFLLFFIWQLLDGARDSWTRWVCLLLAAWFPSQIYFAAVFPVSTAIAAMLGSIFFAIVKRRPIPAAVLGVVAGASYVSGIVLAPALLLASLFCQKGRQRAAAIAGGLGAAAGLFAVALYAQVAVGKWNAYALTKEPYGQGVNNPVITLYHRLRPLWTPQTAQVQFTNTTAAQTLLISCLTLLIVVVTLLSMRRAPSSEPPIVADGPWNRVVSRISSRISVVDLTLLLAVVGAALMPYLVGGPTTTGSTARNETFVIIGIPLLRKLPVYLIVPIVAAAAFLAWRMAGYFYSGTVV